MSAWIIYDKDGLAKCEARKLEYSGEYLGACSVNVSISSPAPIGFELGDWLEYRGERFELNYDPSVIKEASSDTHGEGFAYENVLFNSLSDELTRCDFLDVVPADNHLHYTSLPNFSFFAENVKVLAGRLKANLDRVYKGAKSWNVVVHPDFTGKTDVNVIINNQTCWDVLALAKSEFDANFIIRGRTITIGTGGIAIGRLFSYGMGNGLFKIERSADTNQKIVTRLRAYGSTRNLPSLYYQNLDGGNVPNNMAVKHLMLPSFPYETLDPYIDSKNVSSLGVRESTVFFDGSSGLDEIYPTMEGMTAEDLNKAGVSVNATGALDVIVSAEQIEDDGIIPEGGELKGSFKVVLKDIGFDINEHLSASGTATLAMKSGMCSGREFEIESCEKKDDGYELTCKRTEDSGLGLVFPYNDYPIQSGDKFVLLNIEMPDVYIKSASQRLLSAAKDYLAKNDYVRYSYTPTLDNIFLARQHDEAVKNGEVSIHDTIKEGDFIMFEDEDLGVSGSITIDTLSIKEDSSSSIIPEYDIVLRNEKSVGTIEKIQNQVTSILNGVSGGSVNAEQVKSIVESVGSSRFLSKTKDDTAKGVITFEKGFEVGDFNEGTLGSGAAMFMRDGSSYGEVDFLKVRKKATFTNITIQELKHVGGEIVLSPAAMVCSKVEELADGWKCYFNTEDSDGRKAYNEFEIDDQARCQTFNLKENNYYWRLVTEVGDDYIVLSKTDCDANSGSPKEGDNISQLGNRSNSERQAAIILSAYGTDAPSYKQYNGIDSYSLDGKQVTKLSPYGNELTGVLNIEQGSMGAGNLKDLPSEIFNAVHIGSVNLLRNSGFTGDYKSEETEDMLILGEGSELFSKSLKYWKGSAVVNDDEFAVSGKSVVIGSLSQEVRLMRGENYVVSFKAKGSSVKVALGGETSEKTLADTYESYNVKFVSDGTGVFSITGEATICDLQLERGTIDTDWHASPYDNDRTLAEFQALKYIQDAIQEGDTTILGGLILSSMIQLGNYKDGVMQKVNAGMSGIYNDNNDVAFWGGGTFEQAISTVMKFKQNPNFRPTDEEWRTLSNFVVSHGGDLFLHGNIYAENGYFRGRLEQGNEATVLEKDGSGHLANKNIRWTKEGVMYRRAPENIEWRPITDFSDTRFVTYDAGLYFDLSVHFSDADGYTLSTPDYEEFAIAIMLPYLSRSNAAAILSGNFRVFDGEDYVSVSYLTIDHSYGAEGKTFLLDYYHEAWHIRGEMCVVVEEEWGNTTRTVAYLGRQGNIIIGEDVESRTTIDKEKIKTQKLEINDESEDAIKVKGGIKVGKSILVEDSVGFRTEIDGNKVKTKSVETERVEVSGDLKVLGLMDAVNVGAVNVDAVSVTANGSFNLGIKTGLTKDIEIEAGNGTHTLKFNGGILTGYEFQEIT